MFGQAFYTLAMMHGGLGTPGNYASWVGLHEGMSASPYCMAGDSSNGAGKNPVEPAYAASAHVDPQLGRDRAIPLPGRRSTIPSAGSPFSNGEYGRDAWPGGKKPIDIHVIYSGAYRELAELAAQCQRRH